VSDAPTGPCGVVNVSRFEKDASTKYSFWVYHSKKVVTNPKGEVMPGFACSALDQAEYLFDWRSKEFFMGCAYIEFSPL
jgi:hypothetical protein